MYSKLVNSINMHAVPFTQSTELEPIIHASSQAKYVLLGEATHGTHEFYTIRTAITKNLIENYHFSFIAVEGDWPSCYEVNRYIKGLAPEYKNVEDVLTKAFQRWPSWMWANQELMELIQWLYEFNQHHKEHPIGFYGLDVYSLWESMEAIIHYLEQIQSPDIDQAIRAIECFDPFNRKPEEYGISAAFYGKNCMDEIISLLQAVHNNRKSYENDPESALNMDVNATVASNAEYYYHTMMTSDTESWNIRDQHMVEALQMISHFYGKEAKGIIWEHNTHIGDARATDMADEGMVNVGQLTRELFGNDQVFAVGFGTYQGTVIASRKWGIRHEVMRVPEAIKGSLEDAFHQASPTNQYLLFNQENTSLFNQVSHHRAIGVVYHPDYEEGNYVPTILSKRYDTFIFIDHSNSLIPL